MRRQKGITLVALIITIVVLLILALVAVNSMTQTNIINYTKNAAKNWDESVANEQKELEGHEGYLNNASGTGTTEPELITFTIDETEVGGTVKTYTAEEGMKWNDWIESSYNTSGFYIVHSDAYGMDMVAIGEGNWSFQRW